MPSVDLDAPEHAVCSKVIEGRDRKIAQLNEHVRSLQKLSDLAQDVLDGLHGVKLPAAVIVLLRHLEHALINGGLRELTEAPATQRFVRQKKGPELEKREDGAVVPVDRWEQGIRQIVNILFGPSYSFEIEEVVKRVAELDAVARAEEREACARLVEEDEDKDEWSPRDMARAIRARKKETSDAG